jgi:hypothetical protein
MKVTVFWDVTPCSQVEGQSFRGICCPQKGQKLSTKLYGITSQKAILFDF